MTLDVATLLNERFVTSLCALGLIQLPAVENAFRQVKRHLFLPGIPLPEVYSDKCIITKWQGAEGLSSASQPGLVARVIHQLDLKPGHRVMEIGAGTGFNAALMANIVGAQGRVVTIDIEQDVAAQAARNLRNAGVMNAEVLHRDGALGNLEGGPYDRIVLTVAAADIAPAWREQLVDSGRMVVPLSMKGIQKSIAFEKRGEWLESIDVEDCHYIMLRGTSNAGGERTATEREEVLFGSREVDVRSAVGADLLSQSPRQRRTGIIATMQEVRNDLCLWLALHFLDFLVISGNSAIERRNIFGADVPMTLNRTAAVYENGELCVLSAPPELATLLTASPFEIYLRMFGQDNGLSKRVLDVIRQWLSAGRPGNESLFIRAHTGSGYSEDAEYVLVRSNNTFLFNWPAARRRFLESC